MTHLSLITYIFVLLALAAAYFPLSEKTRHRSGNILIWGATAVLIPVAIGFTVSFAIPFLDNFRHPAVQGRLALLSAAVVEAIGLGLWIAAISCLGSALRRSRPRLDRL